MSIELTTEQVQAVAAEGEAVVVYDDSPWTGHEMALLAGIAFSKLDDDDDYGQFEIFSRETPRLQIRR